MMTNLVRKKPPSSSISSIPIQLKEIKVSYQISPRSTPEKILNKKRKNSQESNGTNKNNYSNGQRKKLITSLQTLSNSHTSLDKIVSHSIPTLSIKIEKEVKEKTNEIEISLDGELLTKGLATRNFERTARKAVYDVREHVSRAKEQIKKLNAENMAALPPSFLNKQLCDVLQDMGNPDSFEELISRMSDPTNKWNSNPGSTESIYSIPKSSATKTGHFNASKNTPKRFSHLITDIASTDKRKKFLTERPGIRTEKYPKLMEEKSTTPLLSSVISKSKFRDFQQRSMDSIVLKSVLVTPISTTPLLPSVISKSKLRDFQQRSMDSTISKSVSLTPKSTVVPFSSSKVIAARTSVRVKIPNGIGKYLDVDITNMGKCSKSDMKLFEEFMNYVNGFISKRSLPPRLPHTSQTSLIEKHDKY